MGPGQTFPATMPPACPCRLLVTLAPSGLSGFCTGIIFGIMLEIVYRVNDPDICDEPDAVSSDAAARSNECCCESGSSGGLAGARGAGGSLRCLETLGVL